VIISGFKWHLNLSGVGATGPKSVDKTEHQLLQSQINQITTKSYIPDSVPGVPSTNLT